MLKLQEADFAPKVLYGIFVRCKVINPQNSTELGVQYKLVTLKPIHNTFTKKKPRKTNKHKKTTVHTYSVEIHRPMHNAIHVHKMFDYAQVEYLLCISICHNGLYMCYMQLNF